jgi:hypothetical protein
MRRDRTAHVPNMMLISILHSKFGKITGKLKFQWRLNLRQMEGFLSYFRVRIEIGLCSVIVGEVWTSEFVGS